MARPLFFLDFWNGNEAHTPFLAAFEAHDKSRPSRPSARRSGRDGPPYYIVRPATVSTASQEDRGMFDDRLPPFEAHGGILEPFDDGHVPETFRCCSSPPAPASTGTSTSRNDDGNNCHDENVPRIVRYPLHHSDSPSVRVYDDALPTTLLDQLYKCTVHPTTGSSSPSKPWGTYVTIEEAVEWMQQFDAKGCEMEHVLNAENVEDQNLDEHRHNLAVAVIALLLMGRKDGEASAVIPTDADDDPPRLLNDLASPSTALKSDAHGVAVWALSSTVGSEVRYHIDYAEQYRYERNITVPPLLAGTVQCTDFGGKDGKSSGSMVGGDFAVNLGGLKHYETNGYKGARSGDDRGGWTDATNNDATNNTCSSAPHHNKQTRWVTVPYRYNRAIFHHGQLPHLSTSIKSISPSGQDAENNRQRSKSRVILGMNVFGHDIGPDVSKAPEHSDAFRRKIKMYRALLSKPSQNGDGSERSSTHDTKLSVEAVKNNKALSKLLVLAKREKIKEDLRKRQTQLTGDILAALDAAEKSDNFSPLTVGELMERLGKPSTESTWPTPTDVHVHLHHLLMGNDEQCVQSDQRIVATEKKNGRDGLVLPSTELSIQNFQINSAT